LAEAGTLLIGALVTAIGSILGIVGGAIGKKAAGGTMIFGGILAFIGTTLFGILPCILLVVGGGLALREKQTNPSIFVTPAPQHNSPPQQNPAVMSQGSPNPSPPSPKPVKSE
jgi:hypothetical protein